MTETWGSEAEAPKPKGGLPRWFWWTCGIGCAVALVAAVIGGGGIFMLVRSSMDTEKVIPKVQKYLPCDPWPEGYKPAGIEVFGSGNYTIHWPGDSIAQLQPWPSAGDLEQHMDPDSMANVVSTDEVLGEAEIQGRMVRTLTYRQTGMHGLRLDLSGDEPPYFVLSFLGNEPPTLEEAARFLEPFDVWRGED